MWSSIGLLNTANNAYDDDIQSNKDIFTLSTLDKNNISLHELNSGVKYIHFQAGMDPLAWWVITLSGEARSI